MPVEEYTADSDLKYIQTVDDIPTIGPDLSQFTNAKKYDAAEVAEAKLEADINNGHTIGSPETLHAKAANAYASFWLFSEAEEPSSALSGQIVEGSAADAAEFAGNILDMYDSLVASIRNSEDDSGEEEQSVFFRAV